MCSSCLLFCNVICSFSTSKTSETFDRFFFAGVGAGGADNDILLSLSLSLLSLFSSWSLVISWVLSTTYVGLIFGRSTTKLSSSHMAGFLSHCQFLNYGHTLSWGLSSMPSAFTLLTIIIVLMHLQHFSNLLPKFLLLLYFWFPYLILVYEQ